MILVRAAHNQVTGFTFADFVESSTDTGIKVIRLGNVPSLEYMLPTIMALDNVINEVIEAVKADKAALEAYLFGSMSRGDYHSESDIDILIISERVETTRNRLQDLGSDLTLKYGVVVSIIVLDARMWERGLSTLASTVKKEGKLIWSRRIK